VIIQSAKKRRLSVIPKVPVEELKKLKEHMFYRYVTSIKRNYLGMLESKPKAIEKKLLLAITLMGITGKRRAK